MPSEEKITAYLRLKYGGDEKFNLETYEPLSARVSDSVFTDIIKEIRKKTNQVFVENTITIVIDSNNIPVFQLIRDNSVTID